MAAISNYSPPVTVEYDKRGKRVRKRFENSHSAKRFYVAKDKAGRHPQVIGDRTARVEKFTAVYVRVSTVGQNEAGQRREIERWLQGNGFDPENVRWFVDKQTGDNLDRPAFKQLQAAVFAGEVGTIVFSASTTPSTREQHTVASH